jgi:hypothetical protein
LIEKQFKEQPIKDEAVKEVMLRIQMVLKDVERKTGDKQASLETLDEIEKAVKELVEEENAKPLPKELHGTVQEVLEDKVLRLSVGSTDGVRKGERFVIYRLEPKAEFVGMAEITVIDARSSLARLVNLVRGQNPRKGDQVSRELKGNAPR